MQDGQLLTQVACEHYDRAGRDRVLDRRPGQARHELGGQSVAQLSVEVVGSDDAFHEPDPGIGVLVREPRTTDDTDGRWAGALERLEDPVRDLTQGPVPCRRDEAGLRAHERLAQTSGGLYRLEAEATAVAEPALVDRFRVDAEVADEGARGGLGDDTAPHRAGRARRLDLLEVPGTGPETVRRRRQRPDRADLNRVAGEIGGERLPREDGNLDTVPAFGEVDEGLARHLLGETGAARALDASFPVEQHEGADLDGLGPVTFLLDEAALSWSVGNRLVLEGTLAPLVAHGAVQGVVEEQELEHALLRLARRLGRGEDLLAVGDRDKARRLQARAPGP